MLLCFPRRWKASEVEPRLCFLRAPLSRRRVAAEWTSRATPAGKISSMNTQTRTRTDIESEQQLRKQVEKAFGELNDKLHGSAERTFDDLLEWIVNGFHIGGKGIEGWRYTPEQTGFFLDAFKVLVRAMHEVLKTHSWYDFLGNIYETFVAGILRKRGAGQFFTPMNVADCMAKIAKPENGESICDPCCGSGRMLLAVHAVNPGAVLFAQDLDRTCVMVSFSPLKRGGMP